MQRIAKILLMVGFVTLAGCATVPSGNYAAVPPEHNRKIAETVITELVKLYPPAQTRFYLLLPIKDAYGIVFIQALRHKGYSILEYASSEPNSVIKQTVPGFNLCYVVDSINSTNLYQVSIFIDTRSISRAFTLAKNGKIHPVGIWIYKE